MLTTTNVLPDNSTDVHFRAWASAISSGLTAAGLSKTTDTGQINLTTVSHPTSSTYAGYEVWKFTDTLQSTVPVLFRIDYGDVSGRPAIKIQAGDTTDGAGNLIGGQISTQFVFDISVSSSSTQSQIAVSGSTNRVAVGLFITNRATITHTPHVFCIERDKDSTGTDTNLGFFVICSTGSPRGTQFIPKASVGTPQISNDHVILTTGRSTGIWGLNFGVFAVFPTLGWVLNPSANIFGYYTADLAENTSIVFSVYNANHTFMSVHGGANEFFSGGGHPMMRYD